MPNPEPKAGDGFGSGGTPLAISGNNALLGAIADDLPGDTHPDGDNPGRVWVFNRETGGVVLTLENPNPQARPAPSDGFGWSVAAGSGIIAVGALRDSTSGVEQSGTVYIFDSETGALEHTLFSSHLIARASFGQTLAITPEGNVLVGDWHAWVDGLEDAGRAYLFDGQTGILLLDIPNPDPKAGDAFGWSVAANSRGMIIGAPTVDSNGLLNTGAVYVFEPVPEAGMMTLLLAGLAVAIVLQQVRRIRVRRV